MTVSPTATSISSGGCAQLLDVFHTRRPPAGARGGRPATHSVQRLLDDAGPHRTLRPERTSRDPSAARRQGHRPRVGPGVRGEQAVAGGRA